MPRKAQTDTLVQVQTRLTPAAHAAMLADMYAAGFGRPAEYLRDLVEAGLARRVCHLEATVGTFGARANALIAATIKSGAAPDQVARLAKQLAALQRDLIRASRT
ncbi:hypothetical protein [Rhodobacter capsulatus]|uniref:hypothetical protein n=1 Tax=Rhodobacter capsulatus TaxID=1061 RepID=UPI00103D023F|nr:hypothetical protein [Rhodobacter capsulatus]